jgi:hypothetical protein
MGGYLPLFIGNCIGMLLAFYYLKKAKEFALM